MINDLDEFEWECARIRARAVEAGKKLGKIGLNTIADTNGITTNFEGVVHLHDGTHIEIVGTRLLLSGSFHFILTNGRTKFIHFGSIREIDIVT